MSCVVNGNGNGYPKPPVNTPEDLNAYLLMLQDIYKPVEQAIDKPAYCTYGKRTVLTKAVSVFVRDNPNLFKKTSTEKKVAIIFDAYRDAYLSVLKEDPHYQKALKLVKQSPMQYFGSPDQLEEAVEFLVLKRMRCFHSTTPENVIQEYLHVEPYSIKFYALPDPYICRDCNLNALTDFFRQTIKS